MACDFCRGVAVEGDQWAEVRLDPDNCLRVEDVLGDTVSVPINYCPMCGQDLREVINADT